MAIKDKLLLFLPMLVYLWHKAAVDTHISILGWAFSNWDTLN